VPGDELGPQPSTSRLALLALLGLGAGLRISGSLDQFWLDEIWSLRTVLGTSSPLDLLTQPHYDNTHVLNSLFLWLVQDARNWVVYRSLSVASSIGLLLLAATYVRAHRLAPALPAVALLSASYPLVVYGSEARGYAPAMLAGLAALLLIDRGDQAGRDRWSLPMLWSALFLGLLAHLSFAFVLLPLAALTAARAWRREAGPRALGPPLAAKFAVPLALAALVYVPYLRSMSIGGGPRHGLTQVLRDWMTLSGGAPRDGALAWLGAGIALAVLAGETAAEFRERDSRWAFSATVLLLPPLTLLLVQPSVLVVRYLIVTTPFLILMLARALDRVSSRGLPGQALAALAFALMLFGNGAHLQAFLTTGRGHYREAVAFIRAGTPGPQATVTSDHDFRNPMMLWFYAPPDPAQKPLVYYSLSHPPEGGTEWLITHSLDRAPGVPERRTVGNVAYRLAYAAPYFGELSGFHWHVYRRLEAETSRAAP
jgi:hypothetical protein